MQAGLPHKQKGAAAIEFAIVFIIFFAVFYGVVAYSLPLLMMQTFNEASAEGARRAVSVDPSTAGNSYPTQVTAIATAAATHALAGLPTALNVGASNVTATYSATGLLTVTIKYPSSNLNSVIPFLILPGVGQVPNLPTYLSASSSLQL